MGIIPNGEIGYCQLRMVPSVVQVPDSKLVVAEASISKTSTSKKQVAAV